MMLTYHVLTSISGYRYPKMNVAVIECSPDHTPKIIKNTKKQRIVKGWWGCNIGTTPRSASARAREDAEILRTLLTKREIKREKQKVRQAKLTAARARARAKLPGLREVEIIEGPTVSKIRRIKGKPTRFEREDVI